MRNHSRSSPTPPLMLGDGKNPYERSHKPTSTKAAMCFWKFWKMCSLGAFFQRPHHNIIVTTILYRILAKFAHIWTKKFETQEVDCASFTNTWPILTSSGSITIYVARAFQRAAAHHLIPFLSKLMTFAVRKLFLQIWISTWTVYAFNFSTRGY